VGAPGVGVRGSARNRLRTRTARAELPQAQPMRPAGRRTLAEELLIVLSLTLLQSAVYSLVSLLTAPVAGVTVASANQNNQLLYQLLGFAFGLVPVFLVLYLIHRDREPPPRFGLVSPYGVGPDVALGSMLAVIVSIVGIGIYLGSVALHLNRFVVPVPPLGHWWTVPLLVLTAIEAALLEELIVVAYMITRLEQIGWSTMAAVGASALLRGSYHLYQGWGGFAGNLLLGLFFGIVFVRTRRVWPLVVAHALIDTLAGLGYIVFRNHLPGL
jgi:membrane protease YdiL (CAAX protease family)